MKNVYQSFVFEFLVKSGSFQNNTVYFAADDDSSDSEVRKVGGKIDTDLKIVPSATVAFQQSGGPDDDDSEDSIDWGSDTSSSGDSSDEYDKNVTLRERFLKRYL